jgi:PAS domain S-box-containing protein
MADTSRLRVLVVEDDADTRANLCDILELDGHDFVAAATAAEALDRDDWPTYAAIVLDWKLPDASAETLLPKLRKLAPDAAVIVSTGVAGLEGAVVALRHGATDYITKPVDADLLRASLHRVAEQRRLVQEKARSEAAFRSLVEAAGSMIVILRPDGTIAYINPFGEQLTGYTSGEVLGRDCAETLLPEVDRVRGVECLQRVLVGQPERGFELPILCRNGETHWLLWNAQRLDDFGGEPAVLAIGQDVTARRLAEEKLRQAERLAAIGTAITGLAHESRNALQRGQANLELLSLLVENQPEAMDLVRRLQRAQDDLHRLYEEVRAYAAPLTLNLESLPVGRVVREAWDLLAHSRNGRAVHFHEEQTNLDLVCRLDRFNMVQVFRNILENALAAAGDPAEISIGYLAEIVDGRPALSIALRDNGPGIAPENCPRIFDEFFTTKTRGTGLGLAIVKRVVEAHGGRVSASPEYRGGAEIVVTLPRGS